MRKIAIFVFLLTCLGGSTRAQTPISTGSTDPSSCSATVGQLYFNNTGTPTSPGAMKYCSGANTWSPVWTSASSAEAYGASPLASGSTNTAAIQTALNAGGLVTISTCGTYNINGHLVISSNTYFRIAPCVQLYEVNGTNDNMIVNKAFSQRGSISGAISYVSGLSGCTNGTQNVTFTDGGGYAAFGTITVSGGVPSGTVTILNPGAWYSSLPTHGTVSTCIGTGTFSGGTLVGATTPITLSWTSNGTEVRVTWNNHQFTANQSYVVIWGASPSTFNGVFQVESVLNANQFTFRTNRLPASAPAGSVVGLAADTNITVDGGQWNYNATGQTGNANGYLAGCTMVIGGAQSVRLRNQLFVNPTQNEVNAGMVRDFFVSDASDVGSAARQFIKTYGPVSNAKIERIATKAPMMV